MFVRCELWSVFSFVDAAQGMEFSPSSRWVAPGGAWSTTTFSSLALGGTQCVSRSSSTPISEDVRRPDQGAQPPGRSGCVGHRGFQGGRGAPSRLQCAKEHVAKPIQSVRLSPDAARTAARLKVDRLEKAVEALGDYDGPELAGLKQALKKARELAQEITQCKEFIERNEKRLAKIEAERIGRKSCTVGSPGTGFLCSCRKRCRRDHGRSRHRGRVGEVASPIGRVPRQCCHRETSRQTESGRWRSRAPHADVGTRRIVQVDGRPSS